MLFIGIILTVIFVLFSLNPIGLSFQTNFTVKNESGRTVFITPVGTADRDSRIVLPITITQIPIIFAYNRGNFKLGPNKTRKIIYNWDDVTFTEIAIKDENDVWRQLSVVEEEEKVCCAPNKYKNYLVGDFDSLDPIDSKVRKAVSKDRINSGVLFFYIMFTGPFLIYFGKKLRISNKRN